MTVMTLLESELGIPASVRVRSNDQQASEFSRDIPDNDFLAGFFFPELADWRPVLDRLGLGLEVAVQLAAQAEVNATSLQAELVASGAVGEAALFQAIADELGLPFASTVDARKLIVLDEDCLALLRRRGASKQVKLEEKDGRTSFLVAPEGLRIGQLRDIFSRHPGAASRVTLTTPGLLRAALLERAGRLLAKTATGDLFERHPAYSARIVVNAWQGSVCGAAAVALPVAAVIAPEITAAALHVFFSLFFLACVGLRFAAIHSAVSEPAVTLKRSIPAEMPVYSVLVALYGEAEIVPELIASLKRLEWPASKLEIKLVCERDDLATLQAIRARPLPPCFEIIEVPTVGPRTKPKALSFALPLVSGELVVLFDAEDRPHPHQLIEAWQRFSAGGEDLACLQAPLEITNRDAGPISRMFAFEYAALFRGLLPWLSRRGLLIPLGGTSNHFRREALEHVGGWDPHNVTEDADLGMRLSRFGYRTETLALPTEEDGPDNFSTWLPQRTRWFKGWLQTWLVHNRNPFTLARELDAGSFVIAQILFGGMVVSALAHPVLVVSALLLSLDLLLDKPLSVWQSAMLVIDVANIACGYLSFILLGWQTLKKPERRGFWKIVLFTPVYWVMMSIAAWRAVWQLWLRPHHWEKTHHRKPNDRADAVPAPTPREIPALRR